VVQPDAGGERENTAASNRSRSASIVAPPGRR
jgi:hypothetical protein